VNLLAALLLAGGVGPGQGAPSGRGQAEDLAVLRPEDQPRKMLYACLVAECGKHFEARRKAVADLRIPQDVRRRQEELRARFLAALGGLPERTPLNARVTGTLPRDGYRIEKVIYESRPDHHVTANLYLPEGKGPFPGVLFPCGHYGNPKAAEEYQRACILLARNGLAALIFDPIGQGERYQTLGPGGRPAAQGTSEHTLVDVGALLVGSCAARHFVWEGMRGLDYLAGRPEIDPRRLGCVGNSGGGTQTAYLMALDERVACAVPNCYITSLERLYATVGPQDGEANIPGQVAFGMGHADYFLLRAPRPSQISCPTRDYYDIGGAWTTFREAKVVYGILGHAERMDLFEWDDKHSISKPSREAALRWLRRWLLGIDDAPVETDFPVSREEELRCTSSGHVMRDFREKTAYDFTADQERELAPKRGKLGREELLEEVRRLIAVGTPARAEPPAVLEPPLGRPGCRITRSLFRTDPGIMVPALVFTPDAVESPPRLIYASGEGKSRDALPGGAIEKWVREGYEVTAVDLRGMGETEPDAPHRGLAPFVRADWKEAYIALNLGRPLLGQRVRDLLAVVGAVDGENRGVHVVGVGSAAPVALHAAALDPRIRRLTLEGMVISWSAVARTPVTVNQLTNVVPGALKVYDLPDLAAAIAPRPLALRGPVDPAGKPVSRAAVEEAYAAARAALGPAFVLEAAGPDR